MYYVSFIANNLIRYAHESKILLTQLKLQKLLYLIYARYLALTNKPLFANRFEAWQYGPVVAEVYWALKNYGNRPIHSMIKSGDGIAYEAKIRGVYAEVFGVVWGRYGSVTAGELVDLTHVGAWLKALEQSNGELGGLLNEEDVKEDGFRFFKYSEK